MPGIPKAKVKIKNCLDTSACQRFAKSNWRNIHRFEIAHEDSEQPAIPLNFGPGQHS
jgi:hypothetical protein